MAVAVQSASSFELSKVERLFTVRPRQSISSTDLFLDDVSPDGKRFLVDTNVADDGLPISMF